MTLKTTTVEPSKVKLNIFTLRSLTITKDLDGVLAICVAKKICLGF